jgi:phospholipase C
MKQRWKSSGATIAMLAMMANNAAFAQTAYSEPALTSATSTGTVGATLATIPTAETALAQNTKVALLRRKIKYVFVLFQENRSFDHYFGTYPGANGLTSTYTGANLSDPMAQPANATGSYSQAIVNVGTGSTISFGTITPFLMPRTVQNVNSQTVNIYPEDSLSVDHSHTGMVHSTHVDVATQSISKNDGYVLDEEGYYYPGDASTTSSVLTKSGNAPITAQPSLAAKQSAELMVAHLDCDTIPFLWQYADRFTLLDNMHQTTFGPSTPNAIAMIAGQTGETQWALHPATTGLHIAGGQSIPNVTDNSPYAGSLSVIAVNGVSPAPDPSAVKPPLGPDEASFASTCTAGQACATPLAPANFGALTTVALKGEQAGYYASQPNLTFASLPLSLEGNNINNFIAADQNPTLDLLDVQADIAKIATATSSVGWGWYQQGYATEPFDGKVTVDTFPSDTPHPSYIVHHNGPQYFGYLADNTQGQAHLHGLQQFYTDVANAALPAGGGVFYVRGGYFNNDGLNTLNPNPNVRATFAGNDDHASYSDTQISEANVADSVNAIAASPYWSQSAIIITYDETDGMYDHVPEAVRSWGPDHLPLAGGPRIPTIVISPYAASHTISHVYSEHSSVIKFIDEVFKLTPLANLPDEAAARLQGYRNPARDLSLYAPDGSRQRELGPADKPGNGIGDLLEAFDNDRLLGKKALLPASYATIPSATVLALPHYNGAGCAALGITPTDYPNGYSVGGENDPPPADFNPRPTVSPGVPTSASWTP